MNFSKAPGYGENSAFIVEGGKLTNWTTFSTQLLECDKILPCSQEMKIVFPRN